MKNEDLELLDKIVSLGGFESRGDAVRAFCLPAFEMCKTAMTTRSMKQAFVVRLQEEKKLMTHLRKIANESEEQVDVIGELVQLNPQAS